jgi:thioesterase domain-containing protein
VEALAAELDQQSTAAPTSLVTLRRGGDGPPLVLIHAVGGTVFSYLELVNRLAPGRPCYALQAAGIGEGETPHDSVEAMARAYVELVRTELAGRPCHLAGWSFGGLVAFEMARLLEAEGSVLSTTLLDAYGPSMVQPAPPEQEVIFQWFAEDIGLELDASELTGLSREAALTHVIARASAASLLPGHIAPADLDRYVRVFEANLQAALRYAPPKYAGDVTLLNATEERALDQKHGFGRLVKGTVTVRPTPGNHYSMMQPPQVDALAGAIDEVMSHADQPKAR